MFADVRSKRTFCELLQYFINPYQHGPSHGKQQVQYGICKNKIQPEKKIQQMYADSFISSFFLLLEGGVSLDVELKTVEELLNERIRTSRP